ncbi:hypothetical protein R5R35_002477 [Gryllus longicercus]|uniref:NADH dehydrogenase [ubiquinone] 1 alpha subcomplex subunit 8 n=1 Tax=Gryllus longicercus TaxID=2509291 RepID=A0AAN9Z395_9ORTH
MVVTKDMYLPTEEELTVEEVPLSSAPLRAGAFHYGKFCENENNEFMLCRNELNDPRKCINEGKAVTACAMTFFRNVKNLCEKEFVQYSNCLDKSSQNFDFEKCRNTQAVLDKCMADKMNIERPEYGYYCRPKVHATSRPKPEPEKPAVYPDATPYLPDDAPRTKANYGSRLYWFN